MRGLLAIIVLAILTLLMSLVGYCSPNSKAAQIEDRINAQYQEEGIGAIADMEGNVAKITGALSSETQRSRAVAIADAARCDRCEGADQKWHEVEDMTTVEIAEPVIPTQSPYTFNARLDEDGTVTLNGYVPSDAARSRVLAEAERHFPGRVVDNTVAVALGQPNDGWADAISLNLNELHLLERGRLSMNETDVVLSGRAATVAVREEINAMAEREPEGYNQVLNIEVIGQAADNVGELTNEDLCQELLNDLNQDNAILFSVSSSRLQAGRPFEVLTGLAGALKQCEGFKVMVEGHTSTTGDDASNLALSKARAATVVTFLADEQEIDSSRLASEGYGETRLKVSPEVTEADRAANRRIEFIVSR